MRQWPCKTSISLAWRYRPIYRTLTFWHQDDIATTVDDACLGSPLANLEGKAGRTPVRFLRRERCVKALSEHGQEQKSRSRSGKSRDAQHEDERSRMRMVLFVKEVQIHHEQSTLDSAPRLLYLQAYGPAPSQCLNDLPGASPPSMFQRSGLFRSTHKYPSQL